MQIKELFNTKKNVISFEIFPPKIESSIETIYETIDALAELKPDYISVTYGAGGSAKNKTAEIASIIKSKYNIEPLAHLTCITSTKVEIDAILAELKNKNVSNILALRGDYPQDSNKKVISAPSFPYACDLISYIKRKDNFSIAAACYPEGHTECIDLSSDLRFLKNKVNCGADFLISQLFFDNELFYGFLQNCDKIGIKVPVEAGIMPVINGNQIKRMTTLCGASMPKRLARIVDKYENKPEALKEAGIAYATEQIIELLSYGVRGIHLYTMNKPEIAQKIMRNIASIISE